MPGSQKKDPTIYLMLLMSAVVLLILVLAVSGFMLVRRQYDDSGSEAGKIYLIKGHSSGSNRYEKVDHLSYTKEIRYTEENLALLDSDGLRITRNEIFARHGRMFNDQILQEYFARQKWYTPKYAASDFDESLLNEVEIYNANLIRSYELSRGYNAELSW